MLLGSKINILMLCVPLGVAAQMAQWGATAVFMLVSSSSQAPGYSCAVDWLRSSGAGFVAMCEAAAATALYTLPPCMPLCMSIYFLRPLQKILHTAWTAQVVTLDCFQGVHLIRNIWHAAFLALTHHSTS
jgi:hypothetical protein